ncbi:MAG: DoxX family protein [Geitlerinemataceae cyanobacterium]
MTSPQAESSNGSSLPRLLFASSSSEGAPFQAFWLVVRLAVGALMIHNGVDKLGDVQGFADNVVSFIGLPFPVFLTYCAAYVEVVSSVLLILGLLTRVNALALLGTMAVAIFFHLKADGFVVPPLETASLYASVYALLLIGGAGQWSLDAIVAKKLDS